MKERRSDLPGRKVEAGDLVTVRGERGRFTVKWIDTFPGSERQPEVTVVGGSAGRVQWRTFRADSVTRCRNGNRDQ